MLEMSLLDLVSPSQGVLWRNKVHWPGEEPLQHHGKTKPLIRMSRTTTISTNSASTRTNQQKTPRNSALLPGPFPSKVKSKPNANSAWTKSSSSLHSKSASTGTAAWKAGRLSFPGSVFPSAPSLNWSNPRPKQNSWRLNRYWDLGQMPMARTELAGIEFPYVEGLRLDEAMNPLTLLCVGHVRRIASESGRSARAHGDSLEVRFQEHQIHHQN